MAKDAKGHGSEKRGGGMPLQGHPYHEKSDAELRFIAKDASEAAKNMQGMGNAQAEGKYLDQVNDASTVLGYRDRGGARVTPLGSLNSTGTPHPKSGAVPLHAGTADANKRLGDRLTKMGFFGKA